MPDLGPGDILASSIRIADDDSAAVYRLTLSVDNGDLAILSAIGEAPAVEVSREGALADLAFFLADLTYTLSANFKGAD